MGKGILLFGSDGFPVVFSWLHVDDILNHTTTKVKLKATFDHILHTKLRLVLISNYLRTDLISQRVKLCGFEYDTSSIPAFRIPQSKVSLAIAITDYLITEL